MFKYTWSYTRCARDIQTSRISLCYMVLKIHVNKTLLMKNTSQRKPSCIIFLDEEKFWMRSCIQVFIPLISSKHSTHQYEFFVRPNMKAQHSPTLTLLMYRISPKTVPIKNPDQIKRKKAYPHYEIISTGTH